MKLIIKKLEKSITEERKEKLLSLNNDNKQVKGVGFTWELTAENIEENEEKIKNFHLFCTSIVLDLLEEKFQTDQKGFKKYKKYKKNKLVIKRLYKLFSIIANDNEKF
jgi:hypothetical protein